MRYISMFSILLLLLVTVGCSLESSGRQEQCHLDRDAGHDGIYIIDETYWLAQGGSIKVFACPQEQVDEIAGRMSKVQQAVGGADTGFEFDDIEVLCIATSLDLHNVQSQLSHYLTMEDSGLLILLYSAENSFRPVVDQEVALLIENQVVRKKIRRSYRFVPQPQGFVQTWLSALDPQLRR